MYIVAGVSTAIVEWNGKEFYSLFRSSVSKRRHGEAPGSWAKLAAQLSTSARNCDRISSTPHCVNVQPPTSPIPLKKSTAMLRSVAVRLAIVRSTTDLVSSKKTMGQHIYYKEEAQTELEPQEHPDAIEH